MSIVKEYFGLFPTILFTSPGYVTPMHFTLCLKNVSWSEKKEIVRLLHHCGANVTFKLAEATSFSIIIVDHNEVVNFYGPAFQLNYITDCLENRKLKDISEYRQCATCQIAEGVSCMDVVYFREQTWDSCISDHEKDWISANSTKDNEWDREYDVNDGCIEATPLSCNSESSILQCSSITSQSSNCRNKQVQGLLGIIERAQKAFNIAEEEKVDNILCSETVDSSSDSNNTSQKKAYSEEERSCILKYITTREEYSRVKGRALWVEMERRKVCPSRTWQSMKEHFLKKIMVNLDSFLFLNNEEKRKLKLSAL